MATATISQQELQQNYAAAEEATHSGPVFITTNGEARSVLIDIDEYRRLYGVAKLTPELAGKSLADLLADPAFDGLPDDFEFPLLDLELRPADFS
jgi:PHD/YefM family antitoxin component YafN of YafNO toxin-antitoxin module